MINGTRGQNAQVIEAARERSSAGLSPEYDRALVVLTAALIGLAGDEYHDLVRHLVLDADVDATAHAWACG